MSKQIYLCGAILFVCISLATGAKAQIVSGGNYTIEKSVIANGGASGATASAGGSFSIEGTIGQNAAGTVQQNSPFKFQPGFWTAAPFAPTAASVSVGGRVLTTDGRGIRNVLISLTGANGETRTVISSAFGYYRFADVPAGGTYILTAAAKRFIFSVPTQVVSLNEDRDDVDFIGEANFLR